MTSFDSAIHRAAVLVKNLPPDQATKVLAHLEASDLQKVFAQIRKLGDVTAELKIAAFEKFIVACSESQKDESNRSRRRRDQTKESTPFEFLAQTTDSIRFQLLSQEHPSCIATVMSFLPSRQASQLLGQFDGKARVAILRRLCQIDNFDKKQVTKHSRHMQRRLFDLLEVAKYQQTGVEVTTRLLSCSDSLTRNQLIDGIESQDPDLAGKLQDELMLFSDLQYFSDKHIKTILAWTDTSNWAPALKTAGQPLQRKILNNMAERPRVILKREIESLVNIDSLISDRARVEIVNTCVQLIERHLIQRWESKKQAA